MTEDPAAVATRKALQAESLFRSARSHVALGEHAAAATQAIAACKIMRRHRIVLAGLGDSDLTLARAALRTSLDVDETAARDAAIVVARLAGVSRVLPLDVAVREAQTPPRPETVYRPPPAAPAAWRPASAGGPRQPAVSQESRVRMIMFTVFGVDIEAVGQRFRTNIRERLARGTYGDVAARDEAGELVARYLQSEPLRRSVKRRRRRGL